MSGGGKLFLGGLAGSTTKETLHYYFGQFGNVVDAVVMGGRGFGFVTFDTAETAHHVLSLEHVLDERTIDVKAADMKGGKGGKGDSGPPPAQPGGAYTNSGGGAYSGGAGRQGGGGGPAGPRTDKIFVGGLPADCGDDTLRSYFQAYGNLVDVVVMKDRMTNKPRGFGFVQYDNYDSADKVMDDYKNHQIGGKWVECKRATPQDQTAKGGGGKGCNGGKGGGGGSYSAPQPYAGYQAAPPAPVYANYGAPAAGYGGAPAYGGAYGAPPPQAYNPYGAPAYGGGKSYAPAPAYGGKGKGKYSPY